MNSRILLLISILLCIHGNIMAQETNLDTIMLSNWKNNIGKSNATFYSNTDSSNIFALRAIKIAKKSKNDSLIGLAQIQIGLTCFLLQEYDVAIKYYDSAISIFKARKDSVNFYKSLANKGNALMYKEQYEETTKIYLKVLEFYNRTDDTIKQAKINGTLGNLFFMKRKYKEAQFHYEKADGYFKLLNFGRGRAICLQNLGLIDKKQEKYDSAMVKFKKAAVFFKKAKQFNSLGQCYANIGEMYAIDSNFAEAKTYLNNSIDILKKVQAQRDLSIVYAQLARIEFDMKNYRESIKILSKSNIDFSTIGDDTEISMYKILAESYKHIGQLSKSIEYYEKLVEFKDSLTRKQLTAKEDELLAKFNVEKREKEIEIYKVSAKLKESQITRQKQTIYFTLITIIILLVMAILLYRRMRYKNSMNKILTERNEEIQAQAEEINAQNDMLELNQKEITASINYAYFIQKAVLHTQNSPEFDVLVVTKPRDIVSGDFFWSSRNGQYFYFAVADCTGHGVPGAFMSILGHSLLNSILSNTEQIEPHLFLEKLREKIKNALHHEDPKILQHDGLDIGLCRVDVKSGKLLFSGAYHPCWIYRDGEITELKPNKQPIGIHPLEKPFEQHEFNLIKSDRIYMFSDGLPDQTNPQNGKLKISGFKNLILKHADKPYAEQKIKLEQFIDDYIGIEEQIDDIIIASIQLK